MCLNSPILTPGRFNAELFTLTGPRNERWQKIMLANDLGMRPKRRLAHVVTTISASPGTSKYAFHVEEAILTYRS